jgi:hypothetical protein
MLALIRITLATIAFLSGGCAGQDTTNPSFNVPVDLAERQLASMRTEPADAQPALQRPLVVLDGFGSPGIGAAVIKHMIGQRVRGTIVGVSYPFAGSFDDCRRHVIDVVDHELGVAGDRETVEVDVVGASLGCTVALYAAIDDPALGKRLKIRRLYTISSPLTGARLAESASWLSFAQLHRELHAGSTFYDRLAKSPPTYEVVSYTRLDDDIVGERYASVPGHGVYWLPNGRFELAHAAAMDDPRIIADILRRLRGEAPLTGETPAPLPRQ